MATQSNILAWKFPWTEEPGGLQFMGLQRVRHNSCCVVIHEQWKQTKNKPMGLHQTNKTFAQQRKLQQMKNQLTEQENIFANYIVNKSLGSNTSLEKDMATHSSILAWRIAWGKEPGRLQSMVSQRVGHNWSDLSQHIQYIQISHTFEHHKNKEPSLKMGRGTEYFLKNNLQMLNRHMKWYSAFWALIFRKMQIKISLRYHLTHHLTPVRMATIKEMTNKHWQGCQERAALLHCQWEHNWCSLYGVWRFLKIWKRKLPYDPAIVFLSIYLSIYMLSIFYCSIIYNSQDIKATEVSINRQMDKKYAAGIYKCVCVHIHIHKGILLSH